MTVLYLTIFVSVLLALGFIVLFMYSRQIGAWSSSERESLMPLQDDAVMSGSTISATEHEQRKDNDRV